MLKPIPPFIYSRVNQISMVLFVPLFALIFINIYRPLDEITINRLLEQSRTEANKLLPPYSQIAKTEIVREGFAHTPKHSIKRFLYK